MKLPIQVGRLVPTEIDVRGAKGRVKTVEIKVVSVLRFSQDLSAKGRVQTSGFHPHIAFFPERSEDRIASWYSLQGFAGRGLDLGWRGRKHVARRVRRFEASLAKNGWHAERARREMARIAALFGRRSEEVKVRPSWPKAYMVSRAER